MTPENKTELINRLKSFAWRIGCYLIVAVVAFITSNLNLLSLPPAVVALIAYVLGEITKYFNNRGITLGGKRIFGGRKPTN